MQFHTFFGIRFIKTSYAECLQDIQSRLQEKKKTLIVTPNPEILYDAHDDKDLATILKSSDIAIPDGVGIFVGYQIMDSKLPKWGKYLMMPVWCIRAIAHTKTFSQQYGERITGSRLTPDILAIAAKNDIGVTIIDPVVVGNNPGDILKRASQEKIQEIIESKYPGILCNVIISDGTEYRAHQTEANSKQNEGNLLNLLNELNPIIIATHGNKRQEKIVSEILASRPETLLGIGIGSSIDLLTGFRTPAPYFFRRFGGEWLYRLYKNPQKHSKRMMRVIRFLGLCLRG